MKTLRVLSLLCLTCFLSGCGNERTIKGAFRLEQWEDGETYYLHRRSQDDSASGGGIIEGTVRRLGWNNRFILVDRHSNYRGDPDGWMIIDVRSEKIIGPFTDAELRARSEASGIQTYRINEAWKKL